MNPAHLHLMTTHLPVLGTVFGVGLLLWALARRSTELKKTALGVFVVAAGLAIPAYWSGQPAAKELRNMPDFRQETVDRHLDIAQLGLAAVLVLGTAALASLIVFRKARPLPAWNLALLLLLSAIACGLLLWTADLGGQVRHTELRAQPR
jgi:NO-binding membrane sensor protein with MHYT domain